MSTVVQETKVKASSTETESFRPKPVVVSAEAEALSHSATTMKLTPSFDLFQMLPEDEGGHLPAPLGGNRQRDGTVLKVGIPDNLEGLKLTNYKGLGGKEKIEKLPDPFKMVEKELQPFADSITELVSTDQPVLSMAAKHFFEKRHGKRFRPTIVQLMAKAVAAATPEDGADQITTDHAGTQGIEGIEWEWSGGSDVQIEGGVVTPGNHKGSEVWRKQAQLGQIVEMIHVASLPAFMEAWLRLVWEDPTFPLRICGICH